MGYLNKLNAKEVNEILSNNDGYYKEVFEMYNYIMLIMAAIDEDRQKEAQNKRGTLSREQINKMKNKSQLSILLGDDTYNTLGTDNKVITIEVTPEDMENARKEKEKRQKEIKEKKLYLPTTRRKSSSSSSRK